MDEKKVCFMVLSVESKSIIIFTLQSATIKQNREKEKLKITHDKQLESLSHDLQKLIDVLKVEEEEYKIIQKFEFFA